MKDFSTLQRALCDIHGAGFMESSDHQVIGISRNFDPTKFPINGLRHPPTGHTTGWYIWSGTDFSEDPSFFVPLHVMHLPERCPEIKKFLGLAPGWRFLF